MAFPSEIEIASKDSSATAIGSVGAKVRPRKGPDRRAADDRDWWCFRRWLLTLGHHNLLFYPFTVRRPTSGGPDFLMHYQHLNATCGLEMTEATNAEDQKERTCGEIEAAGPYTMGDFGGRKYESTSDSALRNDYSNQILEALARKLEKADAYFEKCQSLDFMIYVNNNAGTFVTLDSVAADLTATIHQKNMARGNAQRIGRVAVLDHNKMLICLEGKFRVLRTIDGLS